MTRMCVRIANGSETIEMGVKIGRAGLLPSVLSMWVKAHACRQDPTYVGPFPHTQNLKNAPAYTRIELRTHEYKLCMQARAHTHKNTDISNSSTFSRKHHPKSIVNIFLPLLKHQVFI